MRSARRWPPRNTSPPRVPPTSIMCPLPWQPLQQQQQQQPIQADGREGCVVKVTNHKEVRLGWTATLQQREPPSSNHTTFNQFPPPWRRTTLFNLKTKGSTITTTVTFLSTEPQHVTSSSDCSAPIWKTDNRMTVLNECELIYSHESSCFREMHGNSSFPYFFQTETCSREKLWEWSLWLTMHDFSLHPLISSADPKKGKNINEHWIWSQNI